MDAQTRQAVIAALTTETDPAKLQGFAASIQFQYPIAAGLLWAKAAAMIAQQAVPALLATPVVPARVFPPIPSAPPAPGIIQPPSPAPAPNVPVQPVAPAPSGYAWKLAADADVARDATQLALPGAPCKPVGHRGAGDAQRPPLEVPRHQQPTPDSTLTTFAKDVKGWIASLIPEKRDAGASAVAVSLNGLLRRRPSPVAPSALGQTIATNQDVQSALNPARLLRRLCPRRRRNHRPKEQGLPSLPSSRRATA